MTSVTYGREREKINHHNFSHEYKSGMHSRSTRDGILHSKQKSACFLNLISRLNLKDISLLIRKRIQIKLFRKCV